MTRPGLIRVRRLVMLCVAAAVLAMAAAALAASNAPLLQTGKAKVKGQQKTVVVDSRGMTLYTLSDERVGNLKCLTRACFGFWPPYKVTASQPLTKARNVRGTLGRLRRVKGGFNQLMLNGHPLYRFSGDRAKGQANGEGIRSYGGTWHVVSP
jgi:predicted lipoprotein with Yx(FWY)xxD motif